MFLYSQRATAFMWPDGLAEHFFLFQLMRQDKIVIEDDAVCIVCPVYAVELPFMIVDFMKKAVIRTTKEDIPSLLKMEFIRMTVNCISVWKMSGPGFDR